MCVCGASMMALLHEFVCWMNCCYHSPHWGEGRGRGSRTKQATGRDPDWSYTLHVTRQRYAGVNQG